MQTRRNQGPPVQKTNLSETNLCKSTAVVDSIVGKCWTVKNPTLYKLLILYCTPIIIMCVIMNVIWSHCLTIES